jgi:DNA topoisomerase VI subunit B
MVQSASKLERVTFTFSRANEYFEARELQTMTGQERKKFPDVVVKELFDNALDAAETAGVAPRVCLDLRRRGRLLLVTVIDNGGGISPEMVKKALNFSTRTSDKVAYRAPTRGSQGNAVKTRFGIPYALGVRAPVVIQARGVRHRIRFRIDPAGEVHVEYEPTPVGDTAGTTFTLALPVKACRGTRFGEWARRFALFNPHASVKIRRNRPAGKPLLPLLARARPKPGILTAPRPPSPSPAGGGSSCPPTTPRPGGTTRPPWRGCSSPTSPPTPAGAGGPGRCATSSSSSAG